jgi:rRNA maturation endonuclease Nob1
MSLPLKFAVLCLDCETVSHGRGNQCELCGGRALLSLACVLNRVVQAEEFSERMQSTLSLMGTA